MPITSTYTCDICGAVKADNPERIDHFFGLENRWRNYAGLVVCPSHEKIEYAVFVDGVERRRREVTR